MIISGGVNIYPQEVENVLIDHPKVFDVAVFGVPNEDLGEEVKAVVQPRDMADAGAGSPAELMAFCRQHLSAIKCPRTIDFEPSCRAIRPASSTSACCATYWEGRRARSSRARSVQTELPHPAERAEASPDHALKLLD